MKEMKIKRKHLPSKSFKRKHDFDNFPFPPFSLPLAAAREYLDTLDRDNLPTPEEAVARLREMTADKFREYNAEEEARGYAKRTPPDGLTALQIALLVLKFYDVRLVNIGNIPHSQREDCTLLVYQTDGPWKGIYTSDILSSIDEFMPGLPLLKMMDVMGYMRICAERGKKCVNDRLVPINDGILDTRTGRLKPFSPKYVFLEKYLVDYSEEEKCLVGYSHETSWNDLNHCRRYWEAAGDSPDPDQHWIRFIW